MSLDEDFVKTIKSVKEARAKRQQDESTFVADWKIKKGNVVKPAFEAAAAALLEEAIGERVDSHNGAILLFAGKEPMRGVGPYPYHLSFKSDPEKLEVTYSSTVPGFKGDSVALDELSENSVRDIINEFLTLVVRLL